MRQLLTQKMSQLIYFFNCATVMHTYPCNIYHPMNQLIKSDRAVANTSLLMLCPAGLHYSHPCSIPVATRSIMASCLSCDGRKSLFRLTPNSLPKPCQKLALNDPKKAFTMS